MELITSSFLPIDAKRILATPISPIEVPNRIVWTVATNEKFIIKNAYWLTQSFSKEAIFNPSALNPKKRKKFWKQI